MYESPITRIIEDIMKDIAKREEDYLVELVYKVGFDIGKEGLAKALRYDRDQYEKGFTDGRLSAEPRWIPVAERLPEDAQDVLVTVNDGCTHVETDYFTGAHFLNYWDEVLAWMPIVEPWKGGAE